MSHVGKKGFKLATTAFNLFLRRRSLISSFRHPSAENRRLSVIGTNIDHSFHSSSYMKNPVQISIESKLQESLDPIHLQVINESSQHNVPKGSETHFKVIVVSESFHGKQLLARHRIVYSLLGEQVSGPVHALSLICKTPAEWVASGGQVPASPACMGGSKR